MQLQMIKLPSASFCRKLRSEIILRKGNKLLKILKCSPRKVDQNNLLLAFA